jgi:hypothetical protein
MTTHERGEFEAELRRRGLSSENFEVTESVAESQHPGSDVGWATTVVVQSRRTGVEVSYERLATSYLWIDQFALDLDSGTFERPLV